MVKDILTQIRRALIVTLVLGVILCGIYPLVIWGLALGLFPNQAEGSLIKNGHQVAGSRLIGQGFTGSMYFHPRPSSAGTGYDALQSGGSNLGPLSGKLLGTIKDRVNVYRTENNLPPDSRIPADAVCASGSGLDPHISLANALMQLPRVAKARGMTGGEVRRLIARHTDKPELGFLGQERVHVLRLNLDLDGKDTHD